MSRVFPIPSSLLKKVARFLSCQLRIEYSLTVNDWLKGDLDCLLRSVSHLTVVEAKRDDLTRGVTQLAAALIALSQVEPGQVFHGTVTI